MKKLVAALAISILIPAVATADTQKSSEVAQQTTGTETAATNSTATTTSSDATVKDAPAPVTAPTTTVSTSTRPPPNATPEQLASETGFHMGVGLDNSVGQGTFVNPAYYAYVGSRLELAPSYSFTLLGKKLAASAGAGIGWEFTPPDNDNARRYSWSDLRLGISAPAIYKEKFTGVSISPSLGYSIPLTLESWTAGSLGNLSLSASLSRTFIEKLHTRLGFSVVKGFFGQPYSGISSAYASQRDAAGNLIYICRENAAYCAAAGNNTQWRIGANAGVSYNFSDRLSASVSYGISKGYKTAATDVVDEYTPKAVDSNGNPVAKVGMGQSDNQSGSIGVDYSITDIFSVSANLGNAGPIKTKDNKAFRFPFFNFLGPADGTTQFSVGVSASL